VVELAYTRPGVTQRLAVAVLGLGEAGSAIADGLRSGGAEVRGWDPRPDAGDGLRKAEDPQEAVRGADVVLSVNAASVAVDAARSVFDVLASGQVYADLNSAGAPLKRELASLVAPSGALFADVALAPPRWCRAREQRSSPSACARSACPSTWWATSPVRLRSASCCAACS
jgi:hypothetical protein